ncbi:MAG: alkaline phosphatase D family protein [Bacteriovoracia bacterium]
MRFIWLISLFASLHARALVPLKNFERVDRFAFGSCNRHYKPQPLWSEILATDPQLWIWAGDNVYPPSEATPAGLRIPYEDQLKNPGFHKLRERVPMLGTWDDHDYGQNDGGANYRHKQISQERFLDFLGVSANDVRRVREGVYHSEVLGPKDQQVKFILLDNRYHKRPGDILGEEQWRWLDDELTFSQAKIHFIVSGLSVLSRSVPLSEEWRDDAASFERLMELLEKHRQKGIVILTGDKHFGHFFEHRGFVEFMSSGLTHTVRKPLRASVRRLYSRPFIGLHWGQVDILWGEPLRLRMTLKGRQGRVPQIREYTMRGGAWVLEKSFNEAPPAAKSLVPVPKPLQKKNKPKGISPLPAHREFGNPQF